MDEEVFKILNSPTEPQLKDEPDPLQNAEVLEIAIPVVEKLMSKGMTLEQIKESLEIFWSEPWRDQDTI